MASPTFSPQNEMRMYFSVSCQRSSGVILAEGEYHERNCEHPEDAHKRRVPMIRSEHRPSLEVAHDRHIDEEADTPAPTKFQTPDRHQEVNVHRCGTEISSPQISHCPRVSETKSHASSVRSVSGTTSIAEKTALNAIAISPWPVKYQ